MITPCAPMGNKSGCKENQNSITGFSRKCMFQLNSIWGSKLSGNICLMKNSICFFYSGGSGSVIDIATDLKQDLSLVCLFITNYATVGRMILFRNQGSLHFSMSFLFAVPPLPNPCLASAFPTLGFNCSFHHCWLSGWCDAWGHQSHPLPPHRAHSPTVKLLIAGEYIPEAWKSSGTT